MILQHKQPNLAEIVALSEQTLLRSGFRKFPIPYRKHYFAMVHDDGVRAVMYRQTKRSYPMYELYDVFLFY